MGAKKRILIVDAYTPAHVGNGVLLNSSLAVIKKAWPDGDIRFLSLEMETPKLITDIPYDDFLFRFPVQVGALRKLFWLAWNSLFALLMVANMKSFKVQPSKLAGSQYRRTALKRIEEADLVISITGEALNDRTRKTLPFFLLTYWLAAALGKKMIIFPQSIGPLNRGWTRKLCEWVLNSCSLVVARDSYSVDELVSLGVADNISHFSPDVGVIQPYIDRNTALDLLAIQGVTKDDKTLVGISVSRPKEEGISNVDHIAILTDTIRATFTPDEFKLLILPANMPLPGVDEGDYEDCLDFAQALEGFDLHVLAPRIYSPEEYKGILSILDLFITSRMHVSILATMASTPTITLNTQRKLGGFMSNIGQSDYSMSLDDLDVDTLKTMIDTALLRAPSIRQELIIEEKKMHVSIDNFAEVLMRIASEDSPQI